MRDRDDIPVMLLGLKRDLRQEKDGVIYPQEVSLFFFYFSFYIQVSFARRRGRELTVFRIFFLQVGAQGSSRDEV